MAGTRPMCSLLWPTRLVPRVTLLVMLTALCGACVTPQPRSQLYSRVGTSELTYGALRIRVRDMARRFPGVLEGAADALATRASSPQMRRRLLTLKSDGAAVMQQALLQPDPVAALLDGWALLAQLEQALAVHAEGAEPGLVARARASLEELEGEVEEVWRELTGGADVSEERALVHRWAAEHPLSGPLVARESTAPLLATLTDRAGLSLLGRAAALVEDVQDLTTRVDLYAVSLPRQARWQAEQLTQDVLDAPALDAAAAELSRAVDLLAPVSALAAETPALLARERRAVLGALHAERLGLQEFAAGERQAVLEALHTERVEALQQTQGLGLAMVDRAYDRAAGMLERIFLGLLVLGALLAVGLLGGAALLARAWGRYGPPPPGPWVRRPPAHRPPVTAAGEAERPTASPAQQEPREYH